MSEAAGRPMQQGTVHSDRAAPGLALDLALNFAVELAREQGP